MNALETLDTCRSIRQQMEAALASIELVGPVLVNQKLKASLRAGRNNVVQALRGLDKVGLSAHKQTEVFAQNLGDAILKKLEEKEALKAS